MEKSHPDVMNMLLQILEEGKLTDSQGRTVDFRNTIILMTSNLGAEKAKPGATIGFTTATDEIDYERMREQILDEAKRVFRPEFLNRLDDLIVFRPLSKDDLMIILDLETDKVLERLKSKNIELVFDDKAREFLVGKGYDPEYGARPMRRAVERYLEDPLAEEILKSNIHDGEPVQVSAEEEKLTFTQKAAAEEALSGQ